MRSDALTYLRCPRCRGSLARCADGLGCTRCEARFPVDAGIPRLLPAGAAANGLERRIAALDADMRRHRWVVAKMSLATLCWIPAERARLLGDIGIRPGQTVLDHCTGPGSNLPALAAALGPGGTLVAMDLSALVVRQARALSERRRIDADIHQADASALPYADQTFDAVVHYGAVNQFGADQQRAIDEILRVTRPGGLVVLLDEGLAEHRRDSWWGRRLIRGNPLFACRPPVHLLPPTVEPRVRWVIRGMFWEVRFRTPQEPVAA